jgi:enoyl-[acyl-carrier protein] reductase/trans-2-enoyl-CoA reductase (NAD+)
MVIKPKFKGFICTNAHPVGCRQTVLAQIDYVKSMGEIDGAKNVLIIGASTGFGLATRVVSTFALKANTIGVFFERPATDRRTASAGWYNTVAFEELAQKEGLYAKSINGDAFSDEIKQQTIELIKKDLGKVGLVIYSLASPRRTDPKTCETYYSVLKPIGKTYVDKTVDFHTSEVSEVKIEPANETEIEHTIKVMGGEDWKLWIEAMIEADVLAEGAKTVAYTYLGSKLTYPIYKNGTIGKAKEHLENTVKDLDVVLSKVNGKAYVSANKALVTQASSAIPVVSLYISILYKVMKEKGTHEGTIHQIYRLFRDRLYSDELELDSEGRIRIDDLELSSDVQEEVTKLWQEITSENINELTDIASFRKEFFNLFGFEYDNIDYDEDVEIELNIPSIE